MILAQRETSPAIYFGASVLLFHSTNFWGFWNQNMQNFFTISQNNVLRNFLNLSSLIFLSSWTADFAKKAKRVSFNLYFKDARRLFLKLVNLIKISWLANIYTQYCINVVSLIVMIKYRVLTCRVHRISKYPKPPTEHDARQGLEVL